MQQSGSSQQGIVRHPVGSIACRLLLVLSLWDGPVLWGHQHTPELSSLDEHLARFHQGVVDPLALGWHWHFSFPTDADGRQSDQRTSRPAAIVMAGSGQGCLAGHAIGPVLSGRDWMKSSASSQPGQWNRQLLSAIPRSGSPQQTLCCLRC